MAKRSQSRLVRRGKDQIGCMRSLISIFGFRHSRSLKLLFDRRQTVGGQHSKSQLLLTNPDEKCQGINDGSESKTAIAVYGKTSVKELMEEEMVNEQELNNCPHAKKSCKSTRPCDSHVCDPSAENFESQNSSLQVLEQNTLNNLDLEVILRGFFHLLHQDSTGCVKHDVLDVQLYQKYPVFEEKLRAALLEDGKMHHSKEFVDALQALSSNKESFFKLLKKPNSLLVKFIQDLGNELQEGDQKSKPVALEELSNSRSSKLVNSKFHKFFRRKNKPRGWSRLKENEKCQPTNRIVVLKTGTHLEFGCWSGNNGKNERVGSQFSFAEIKRKLQHAMGKEHRLIPYDKGIGKPKYTERNTGNETSEPSERKVLNIYIEARKHLSEMLSDGGKIEDFFSKQSSKTLGGILSLSDLVASPICGPHEVNFPNSNSNLCAMEETRDGRDFEGDVEIVEMADMNFQDENEILDVAATSYSLPIAIDCERDDAANICKEERTSQCLKLDSFEEDQPLSTPSAFPSTSSVTIIVEDQEYAKEAPVHPSLEPLFTKDDFSPTCEERKHPLPIHLEEQVSCHVNHGICTRTSMENEESAFEYVEAVLLGSGLNWDEFLLRWLSSEELLEPSLFDEVELFSSHSFQEQKLLFDCTNEVLKEVCDHYFGNSPWVSFVKQNIRPVPRAKNLISEVWKGVEWNLLVQPLPRTLDQIVRKDMEKSGTWMDIRSDTESIVIEMGQAIFEELMEEIVSSFVYRRREIEFSVELI